MACIIGSLLGGEEKKPHTEARRSPQSSAVWIQSQAGGKKTCPSNTIRLWVKNKMFHFPDCFQEDIFTPPSSKLPPVTFSDLNSLFLFALMPPLFIKDLLTCTPRGNSFKVTLLKNNFHHKFSFCEAIFLNEAIWKIPLLCFLYFSFCLRSSLCLGGAVGARGSQEEK